MSASTGMETSPAPTASGAASASPSIAPSNGVATPSSAEPSKPASNPEPDTTSTNGAPVAKEPTPPPAPLEDQEMLAFGSTAEHDILPPPPRDPNAPLAALGDGSGDANGNGNGTKRSMGTGAASGPLARAKRPKNVKFSPAKVGKQLARRAAAPGVGGAEVLLANNDYCDSCGGKGHFLCCEGGCLRSFHFGCLEPPLEIDEVPEESWFCKACRAKAHPPPRLPPGFFSELIYNVEKENPKAFQLSTDLKTFYKNVAVGLNGEFIDSNEHRPPSKITGRAVGQEDRDGYRLKDKNGRPIICYNCSQAANPHIHRRIISCDFCDQHWHLDCLNPPMTGMPPPTRKWMCPVHSEHVLPKKRVPRQTTVVNIEERGISNNGDIIVQPPPERPPPEEYEEMTVNRIRYQVPEQNIILDFWGKVVPPSRRTEEKAKKRASPRKKRVAGNGYESGNSSPLTDLSSSEDEDVEMVDSRPAKPASRSVRATSTPAPNPLDNLALLAEVRYIDLLRDSESPATNPAQTSSSSSISQNAPLPSTSTTSASIPPSTASASGTPRLSSSSLFAPGSATTGTASPTSTSIPLAGSARRTSPSLSPAPVGSAASRGTTPQAELTVQSKEDLKALMQVRKLLLSQGQAQGNTKTTMLSFLEGAPIIPKLAFVNNSKATSWQRPWEGKKDGPRPGGSGQPATPGATSSSQNPVSPGPSSAQAPDALSKSVGASATSAAIKVEGGGNEGASLSRASTLPSKRERPAPSPAPSTGGTPASSKASLPPAPLPPSARPSHSPVLSSHHIPTPYSSDMPFQLPAFRPPSATPAPPRTDSMQVDSSQSQQTKK
ncbi:hypothetical protein JCM5350_002799 [Sporobolomyces pararoseus]